MSYLLDALRKADRERQLGTVPDLATPIESAVDAKRATPAWSVWIIVTIMTLNIAVLALILWQWTDVFADPTTSAPLTPAVSVPQSAPDRQQPMLEPRSMPARGVPASGQLAHRPTVTTAAAVQAEPAATQSPAQARTALGAATSSNARAAGAPAGHSSLELARLRTNTANSGLAHDAPERRFAPAPLLQSLSASVRAGLPDYTVNGLLYSARPGLSFVLINDGRYHEGERIPGAGAVQTITADGAVINYKGRRFRLRAPH